MTTLETDSSVAPATDAASVPAAAVKPQRSAQDAPGFALTPPAANLTMSVTKRSGRREPVDLNKIVRAVTRCAEGL